jgi:hypothetical protein
MNYTLAGFEPGSGGCDNPPRHAAIFGQWSVLFFLSNWLHGCRVFQGDLKWLLSLCRFFYYRRSRNIWSAYFHWKSNVLILTGKRVGRHFGQYFQKTHLATLVPFSSDWQWSAHARGAPSARSRRPWRRCSAATRPPTGWSAEPTGASFFFFFYGPPHVPWNGWACKIGLRPSVFELKNLLSSGGLGVCTYVSTLSWTETQSLLPRSCLCLKTLQFSNWSNELNLFIPWK